MKKMYEVQVKDDGKFEPIKITGSVNAFETRAEAETAMNNHKQQFPYRLTMRVSEIK